MSLNIWTLCEGVRRQKSLALDVWRVVEGQHVVSTRKLVDSDDEQHLLETLIDTAKPNVPDDIAPLKLDFLLYTPFRYPPLTYGSRFGTRTERGIFYGSLKPETALAEKAYHRLLFLEATEGDLGLLETEHTAFRVGVRTEHGIDLTEFPFTRFEAQISSPTQYTDTHTLGRQMREAGVEGFVFVSARAPQRGLNVGLFAPAFSSRVPHRRRPVWWCSASKQRVEFREKNTLHPKSMTFEREVFLVNGALPRPGA
ncbi:MAG: RES family NAD+ phosphorylase [Myxococcaceae bacterium]